MNATGKCRVELFAANTRIINKEFPWQNAMSLRLASLLYAKEGKTVNCEAIRQCHALVKQNTGVFSAFRGNMAFSLAALLSLYPKPRDVLKETLKVYDLLKGVKFHASDFLVGAAYQIASQSNPSDYVGVITRARSYYDGMKARHFYNTGQDDYIYAAMLGLADIDASSSIERIERLYSRLKDEFWDKNSVQALAQVLVIGGLDESVIDRVFALRDAFRAQKIRLDKTYTLPMLGILALVPVEIDTIVRDIDDAQGALRAQKGFGSLSVTTQELLLYISSVIAGVYAENAKEGGVLTAALSTSITNMIIAQQAAMTAAVCASAAAASAST